MATKTRFEAALEGAQLDVNAVDALHVIKHKIEGLRMAFRDLSCGPDEPTPEMFDAVDVLVDDLACGIAALIETAEPALEPVR